MGSNPDITQTRWKDTIKNEKIKAVEWGFLSTPNKKIINEE
jgi:hypothetical protein